MRLAVRLADRDGYRRRQRIDCGPPPAQPSSDLAGPARDAKRFRGIVSLAAVTRPPSNTTPEETFRDFVVLDEGGVVAAHRTEDGVTHETYDCE